ncbi:unnamed protein product [Didymodactylos carnosus]|uniref:Dienelactone hydrolase domain-containing protein n=1 Tax=Didymodactylos carnosus TaxID=1234261 RepID=A0A815TQ88_9BILA|nr:unnamed protein product [Didymodactylos carnosus]CAF4370529.1 unnamed protein product [Didymodactylos carnosus]
MTNLNYLSLFLATTVFVVNNAGPTILHGNASYYGASTPKIPGRSKLFVDLKNDRGKVLAKSSSNAKKFPIKFQLKYSADKLDKNSNYSLTASIKSANKKLLYANNVDMPLILYGNSKTTHVHVQMVDSVPSYAKYRKGVIHNINDLKVYDVGQNSSSSSMAVIILYDALGFNIEQTRMFAERLAAETNARVLMPDFFRGNALPYSALHPYQPKVVTTWIEKSPSWTMIEKELKMLSKELRASGKIKKLAVIGFCWGGFHVVKACSEPQLVDSGISIHGSMLNMTNPNQIQKPIMFLKGNNDPSLNEIKAVLDKKPFGSKCEYKNYENMAHGFVTAKANFHSKENVEAIDDVHQKCIKFLKNTT